MTMLRSDGSDAGVLRRAKTTIGGMQASRHPIDGGEASPACNHLQHAVRLDANCDRTGPHFGAPACCGEGTLCAITRVTREVAMSWSGFGWWASLKAKREAKRAGEDDHADMGTAFGLDASLDTVIGEVSSSGGAAPRSAATPWEHRLIRRSNL
jgi:hypothetical protein